MSKEGSKDSKGHHGIHLHLPGKKPGRSLSAGRVSPISFFVGHRKSSNGHAKGENGNGNGGNGTGIGVSAGIKDSVSAPSSSHVSPTGSPTHPRKGSFGSTIHPPLPRTKSNSIQPQHFHVSHTTPHNMHLMGQNGSNHDPSSQTPPTSSSNSSVGTRHASLTPPTTSSHHTSPGRHLSLPINRQSSTESTSSSVAPPSSSSHSSAKHSASSASSRNNSIVPAIPVPVNHPELDQLSPLTPTTTSQKAARKPVVGPDQSPRRTLRHTTSAGRRRFSTSLSSSASLDEEDSDSEYSESGSSEDETSPCDKVLTSRKGFSDFRVKSLKHSSIGRKVIGIAEQEMPGLKVLRRKTCVTTGEKPLSGAKIIGCTHITAQSAVLIETLVECGAQVRWCACNIHSTQNEVAAALAEAGLPIFAWSGQNEEEFWWCIDQCIQADGWQPNMILDDGGDATHRLLTKFKGLAHYVQGIVEESVTGIHRLYQLSKEDKLPMPAINVHDSVVKTKFDNLYACRESIIDCLKRTMDIMFGGKIVCVCGYGEVGKGCCSSMKGLGSVVFVTEVDPICALQACMDGFRVVKLDDVLPLLDILVTATGTKNIVSRRHVERLKSGCILANMGHSNQEIDMDSLRELHCEKIRKHVTHIHLPNGKKVFLLAEVHTIHHPPREITTPTLKMEVTLAKLNIIKWSNDLLVEMSINWRTWGETAQINVAKLDGYETQYQKNEDRMRATAIEWMRTYSPKVPSDYPATWEGLIKLLKDIPNLACKIEQAAADPQSTIHPH